MLNRSLFEDFIGKQLSDYEFQSICYVVEQCLQNEGEFVMFNRVVSREDLILLCDEELPTPRHATMCAYKEQAEAWWQEAMDKLLSEGP